MRYGLRGPLAKCATSKFQASNEAACSHGNMRANGVPSLMVFCSARKDCERMHTVTIYRCPLSAPGCAANGAAELADVAVLRLMTSSYLVEACTGRSVDFSPLSKRST
jgi:hypothetical protein